MSSEKKARSIDWLPYSLLLAIICVVPAIVYMRVVAFEGIASQLYGRVAESEFFSGYKAQWLYILCGSAMLWFLINRKAPQNRYHKPLAVYCFLITASTVFSQYRSLAFFGDPFRFEGLMTHFCYMAITFLFLNLVKTKTDLKLFIYPFIAVSALMAAVGILQFMGCDYFYSDFGTWALIPRKVKTVAPAISMTGHTKTFGTIFLTFGNRNFTGSYAAMLYVFTLVTLISSNNITRFLFFPLNVAFYAILLGSHSRAGILAGFIAAIIVVFYMRKCLKKRVGLTLLYILALVVVPFVLDAYALAHDNPRLFSFRSVMMPYRPIGRLEDLKIEKDLVTVVYDGYRFQIKYNDGNIEFYDKNGELAPYQLIAASEANKQMQLNGASATERIKAASGQLTCSPATGIALAVGLEKPAALATGLEKPIALATGLEKPIALAAGLEKPIASASLSLLKSSKERASEDENGLGGICSAEADPSAIYKESEYFVVFKPGFMPFFQIKTLPKSNVIKVSRGDKGFYIGYFNDSFSLLNAYMQPAKIQDIETIGFKNSEAFASNRGYIWARTLPLLKQCIAIGFGPDTFVAHFPQHDYLGKLRTWPSGVNQIIEKPHSLYLQIAVNSGVLSLLVMLLMWLQYLCETFKTYRKNDFSSFSATIGLALAAAIIAYLIAGIFNDSINGIAPIFWAFLGMGIATNKINSCKKQAA